MNNSIKVRTNEYKIAAFYCFTLLPDETLNLALNNLRMIGLQNQVKGTILLAQEGINGTICAEEKVIEIVLEIIKIYTGPNELNLKVSFSKTKVFKKLKIKIKKEIVTMGVPKINPSQDAVTYIVSFTWNKLI